MLPPTRSPNDMDTPYPSTLGPDTGIIKVPGRPLYPCANDCETNGGTCRSYEKVTNPNAKCSNCKALGLSLGYGIQDTQWQIALGSDSGILEMGDYQDVCVNASVTGGLYHSGENVWQAGGGRGPPAPLPPSRSERDSRRTDRLPERRESTSQSGQGTLIAHLINTFKDVILSANSTVTTTLKDVALLADLTQRTTPG